MVAQTHAWKIVPFYTLLSRISNCLGWTSTRIHTMVKIPQNSFKLFVKVTNIPFNMDLKYPYSVKWLIERNIRVWGAESFLFSQQLFFFQFVFSLLCPVLFSDLIFEKFCSARSFIIPYHCRKVYQIVNWICTWIRAILLDENHKLNPWSLVSKTKEKWQIQAIPACHHFGGKSNWFQPTKKS